jgi:PAS domain S-box-containing protein
MSKARVVRESEYDAKAFAASLDEGFLLFLETVPDAMILSDRKGRIILVNGNTERMFGYSREELVGQEVEFLVPERFQALHREHRATYYADPKMRRMGVGRDQRARRKDGVELTIEISLSPVEINGYWLVWSAIRDISVREHSIAALLESLHKKGLILGGLISICAWCKRVRDRGSWQGLDRYVASHSQAKFTHCICFECMRTLDPANHKPNDRLSVTPPDSA